MRSICSNEIGIKDVLIPSEIPVGDKLVPIKSIGSKFCQGLFSKVTISDAIKTISPHAFYMSYASEVVWPASCVVIPDMCFMYSQITKISNIDNVVEVGIRAFEESRIQSIDWPSGCESVSHACFANSRLSTITNTSHISNIAIFAFSHSMLKEIDLSGASIVNVGIGAFAGIDPNNVKLPYYSSAENFSQAF